MNPALAKAKKATDNIEREYNNRVRSADKDEALEFAISRVYGERSEDAQADLFGAIRHLFDDYPSGITRKMALRSAIRNYEIRRVLGSSI